MVCQGYLNMLRHDILAQRVPQTLRRSDGLGHTVDAHGAEIRRIPM